MESRGPCGVGKSTFLLQHIKERFPDRSKVLYVSLDNMRFCSNDLIDLVEYNYTHGGTHIFLDENLSSHISIASAIVSKIKILPFFEKYLSIGYYPFYKEEGAGYQSRAQEVITQTIEMDIPAVEEVEYGTLQKLKKLLMILAVQAPFIPKMNELYQELDTNRE